VDERLYFVDLPGYGYAKVSKTVKESWGPMIEDYLHNREQLKLAIMLVDSRMPPTDSDQMMKQWLDRHRIPNTVVLTKTDKLSKNQLNHALRLGVQTLNTKEIIAFSAVTGAGREEILARISAATTSDPTVRKTHL
jgi:GTP-binding protein